MTKDRQEAPGARPQDREQPEGHPEDADAVGREAWAAMYQVAQLLRERGSAVASEYELSPPQMHLLHCLQPSTPMSMSHAANMLGCDASNVTGLTDRLEKRGLVERQPSDQDRRVKMLVLTAEGVQQREAVSERLSRVPPIFQRLSFEELRTLRDIMRRAIELEAAEAEKAAPPIVAGAEP